MRFPSPGKFKTSFFRVPCRRCRESRSRQGTRKELALNFPGDGNLILKTAALVFLLDKIRDRPGPLVERFAQFTQLVAPLDLNAMREAPGLPVSRAPV